MNRIANSCLCMLSMSIHCIQSTLNRMSESRQDTGYAVCHTHKNSMMFWQFILIEGIGHSSAYFHYLPDNFKETHCYTISWYLIRCAILAFEKSRCSLHTLASLLLPQCPDYIHTLALILCGSHIQIN